MGNRRRADAVSGDGWLLGKSESCIRAIERDYRRRESVFW